MSEPVRAFVAVELSQEMTRALATLIQRLERAGLSGVRWVDTEGIHLTLKFLGNIPQARVEEITRSLSRSVSTSGSFDLSIGDPGVFPSQAAARVLWVGLKGNLEALAALQQKVEEALEGLGFPRERRPFAPHLTLARLKDRATPIERRRAAEALLKTGSVPEATMKVESISLIQSTLLPSGAVYSRLASISLSQ